ncbi:uncharacterized protein LAESUDRAFT_756725 [Laetiporus sulphureus 93-53]|uniref:Uncharacterized protein n=1 Tax=Laetiporus sulphureus 93-53 TaxID=1314785 RepID=A0A165G465_9APHY|nr:uncharacterized protein LAESUDRAFT_756725 [Laetiporus sulphureus 93-53]KZT09805.1 hypothetical protein LAESUDRAFT_756725 [Laetiporus sulphureus 93-53]
MRLEQTGATMAMQLFLKTNVCLISTAMSFSAGARSPEAACEDHAFNHADAIQLAEAIRYLFPTLKAPWRLTNAHIPIEEVEFTPDIKSLLVPLRLKINFREHAFNLCTLMASLRTSPEALSESAILHTLRVKED